MRGVTVRIRGSVLPGESEQFPGHDAPEDFAPVLEYSMGDAPLDWGNAPEWRAPDQRAQPVTVRGEDGQWLEL